MVWTPRVTVAAIVEKDGRFLLVEEVDQGGTVLNQPAGHLEAGETLLEAVQRETLEETAWQFTPQALLGVYRWQHPRKNRTFLRFAIIGSVSRHDPERALDRGIVRALWLTADEIRRDQARHRSPQVQRCIDDYLAGRRAELTLLNEVPGQTPAGPSE